MSLDIIVDEQVLKCCGSEVSLRIAEVSEGQAKPNIFG
jgi:hypothetical protein